MSIAQSHRSRRWEGAERAAIDTSFPVLDLFAMADTIAADMAEEQVSPDASRRVRRARRTRPIRSMLPREARRPGSSPRRHGEGTHMPELDTVIRNAVVVTAADVFASDIGIAGGVVAALGRDLGPARRDIDAAGRYVLPGGIDAHCHFDQPMRGSVTLADDFLSGPISAAPGGTTTVVPFACQLQGQSVRAAVEDYHRRAAGKPVIDYAFHLIVSDPTEDVLRRELPALIAEGYTSFKIYMTYETLKLDDRQIIAVLAVARREGAMVMVHAENSDCIAWLTEELERAGRTAPYFHAASRPPAVEREGTHRAITMSELVDVPILLVHVSAADAVEQIH